MGPELRQMRYVVAVADTLSFTRAAERLHLAQQALSQQVKVVEEQLGVQLFARTNRGVEVTAAGQVFVQEARRVLAAADRLGERTQAAARGEAGLVRLAYTLTTVYETLPALAERLAERHPQLRVELREVYGGDVERLLLDARHDMALCPRTAVPDSLRARAVRRERFVVAVGEDHPLASRGPVAVRELRRETLELWPRDMAPGYYDAVVAVCREAGFQPRIDEAGSGSTVWGAIAQGRGVGLVVASLAEQVPRGVVLVALEEPAPRLTIDVVCHGEHDAEAVRRVLEVAAEVGAERGWLVAPSARAPWT